MSGRGTAAPIAREQRIALAATFFNFLSWQMVLPIMPLLGSVRGATPEQTGQLVAAFSGAALFFAMPAGAVVRRMGTRAAILVACLVMTVAAVLSILLPSIAGLAAGAALLGLGQVLFLVATLTHLSRLSGLHRLNANYVYFSVSSGAAGVVGPSAGAWLLSVAAPLTLIGSATAGLAGLVFALLLAPLRDEDERQAGVEGASRLSINGGNWLLVGLMILAGALPQVANGLRFTVYPLFLQDVGLQPVMIGTLISIQSIAALVVQLSVLRVAARLGRPRTIIISNGLAALGVVLTQFGRVPWILAGGAALWGQTGGVTQPLSIAGTATHAPARLRPLVIGMQITVHRLVLTVTPVVFGYAMGRGQTGVTFATTIAAFIIAATLMMLAPRDA